MPGSRCRARAAAVLVLSALVLAASPATAAAQTPPGPPTGVLVTAGDASAVVSWQAPDDGGATISGYTVTADSGDARVSVPGVARSGSVTGLVNGVPYRFTVTATNRAGTGPPSAVSNVVTPAVPVPDTVRGPVLVDVDFTEPADDFVPIAGSWAVAVGRYTLSAPEDGGEEVPNANLAVHGTAVTGDFTLTATAATTPTDSPFNDFSIVFGYRDTDHYSFASFSEGNDDKISGIFTVVDGRRTELADIPSAVVAGTVYPIRVEREGPAIRVYRSDELVASATDPSAPDGRVGFGSRNDGGTFDDLLVTGPAPPPSPPPPPPGLVARVWAWLGSLWS